MSKILTLFLLLAKTSCIQGLDQCIVGDGCESLWNVVLGRYMTGLAGLDGLPLNVHTVYIIGRYKLNDT